MTKTTIVERVKEMTRQAREREGEKLLALDLVKRAVSEAAGQGYSRAVIAPTKPLDLTKTDTAKATVAHLEKEGFGVEWLKHQSAEGDVSFALVVRW